MIEPKWAGQVDDDDFEAAEAYLTILLDPSRAAKAVKALRGERLTHRRANDILRGTHREPLSVTDPGVARTRAKIARGESLNPILVVSWSHGGDIADGYHRVSAAYAFDPFADVALVLAHVPRLRDI